MCIEELMGKTLQVNGNCDNSKNDISFTILLSHFSRMQLFATPWAVALQTPLSMGFSSQEY